MSPFFFYGTLADEDVLAAVLGRLPAGATAALDGYRRVYVAGTAYPMLVPLTGSSVDGRLVGGLGRRDAWRLHAFEGEEYRLASVRVRRHPGGECTALAFLAAEGLVPSVEPWDLRAWRRRHKRLYMRRIAPWLSGSGVVEGRLSRWRPRTASR